MCALHPAKIYLFAAKALPELYLEWCWFESSLWSSSYPLTPGPGRIQTLSYRWPLKGLLAFVGWRWIHRKFPPPHTPWALHIDGSNVSRRHWKKKSKSVLTKEETWKFFIFEMEMCLVRLKVSPRAPEAVSVSQLWFLFLFCCDDQVHVAPGDLYNSVTTLHVYCFFRFF